MKTTNEIIAHINREIAEHKSQLPNLIKEEEAVRYGMMDKTKINMEITTRLLMVKEKLTFIRIAITVLEDLKEQISQ